MQTKKPTKILEKRKEKNDHKDHFRAARFVRNTAHRKPGVEKLSIILLKCRSISILGVGPSDNTTGIRHSVSSEGGKGVFLILLSIQTNTG
jgi:hypothetical protein